MSLIRKLNWPYTQQRAIFILLLRSFSIGHECKIFLSVCGRGTNNDWIPPIQNTQINCAEVARCSLLVSCSTDLDYCLVFVDQVGVFLGHGHRILKASEQFTPDSPIISLYFCLPFSSGSNHHNHCNIHLNTESAKPASKSVFMTTFWGNSRTFYIKSENVFKYYSQTLFTNNVHRDCSYIKNWL